MDEEVKRRVDALWGEIGCRNKKAGTSPAVQRARRLRT
jgi:hypothetical protein